jgi:predicted lipoprotein with Yx(FWY)xxD motif
LANPTAADPDRRPAPPPASTPSTQTKPGTTIDAAADDVGTILFDATGQALYIFDIFDVEITTKPRCYDAFADASPPVLIQAGRKPVKA